MGAGGFLHRGGSESFSLAANLSRHDAAVVALAGGDERGQRRGGDFGRRRTDLAGRVDVMVDTMTLTASLLKDQRVRAIAVTSPPGASPVTGVPAIADQYPGVVFESWLGIAAPASTPPELVERLNKELRAVLNQEDVKQKLISFGGSPSASSPNEFKMRVERDIRSLKKVIQDKKIELE